MSRFDGIESFSIVLFDYFCFFVVHFQDSFGHVDLHPEIAVDHLEFIEVSEHFSVLVFEGFALYDLD